FGGAIAPSSICPSQLSSSPLQSSCADVGVQSSRQRWEPSLSMCPAAQPSKTQPASQLKMALGAPAPQAVPQTPQWAGSFETEKPSSMRPLQSLSMPSQTSGPPVAPGQSTSQPLAATPSR